jgi:hypothetical protein
MCWEDKETGSHAPGFKVRGGLARLGARGRRPLGGPRVPREGAERRARVLDVARCGRRDISRVPHGSGRGDAGPAHLRHRDAVRRLCDPSPSRQHVTLQESGECVRAECDERPGLSRLQWVQRFGMWCGQV